MPRVLSGAAIFDGTRLHHGHALVIDEGRVTALLPEAQATGARIMLEGGVLAPGMIDLQVNGGDGIAVDGRTDAAALREICAVHARLGATGILPTLITDTPEATAQVIAAGLAAAAQAVPGFLGLHLEGPHLDPRRKGAHDPALIRPMTAQDLDRLCSAARALPALMLTVAPEAATPEQIAALAQAGAVVSLGHTDCSAETAQAAIAAGAVCATHLFNAMSQLGNREPGLVGAVLDGSVSAGLIADGIHVAPAVLRIALKARPQGMFLVSDAMALAGTDLTGITLGGRQVLRREGRLTLADGTLAGADLTLPRAVGVLVTQAGIAPEVAVRMATADPAAVIGRSGDLGHLLPGRRADMVHLRPDWSLASVWRAGVAL
jgi:N-acetylglucosamine-6-phosphate deacetylase